MFLSPRLVLASAMGSVGAALLAAALPGGAWAALAAVNLMLAGLVMADVAAATRPERLRLRREVAPVLRTGRRAAVELHLHNPSRRALEVTARDASPPSLARKPPRHRARLPPGGWGVLPAEISPSRRGFADLGPVTLRVAGPLGLAGRQATLSLPARLKVYPALPGRAEVELRLERAMLLLAGERSAAVRGGGTDFDSLREYHPDDEFRRINWRATARAAKAISNVYREERNQQVMLMMDAGRTMATSVAGVTRFEHALDASLAVAELAARVGDHVGMVAFGRDVLAMVGPRSGRTQPRRILDALFDLEPELSAPNYARAFSLLLARCRRRALLVLVTELADESSMETLFAAVPSLVRRHLLLVGSVVDPELEALATSAPSSSEEVYLKAAASEALLARGRTAGLLRRMGAVVIDLPPGKLAGRLADEYLRIKAFGRL